MKAFIDANVIFTAALTPGGKAARIIGKASELGIQLFTNDYALGEAYRNLDKKAPHALLSFGELRQHFTIMHTVTQGPTPDALPEKDKPIWLGALSAGCDVLVTGDNKDFKKLPVHASLRVLTPAEWYDEVV
jgi:predicted nucleic acid-binding protein